MENLYLKQLKIGPMANFVYLIGCPKTRRCAVVDPAWDINAIMSAAEKDGYTIESVLVTHYHPDHVGGHLWGHDIEGITEIAPKTGGKIYANKLELDGLSTVTGLAKSSFIPLESGQTVQVGNVAISAIHTPGHTPGSQCFAVNQQLVSGDTLFISGCGRVDLPGGNKDQLFDSLHHILKKFPDETILLPGHDYDDRPTANLGYVRSINPYLKVADKTEWNRVR